MTVLKRRLRGAWRGGLAMVVGMGIGTVVGAPVAGMLFVIAAALYKYASTILILVALLCGSVVFGFLWPEKFETKDEAAS